MNFKGGCEKFNIESAIRISFCVIARSLCSFKKTESESTVRSDAGSEDSVISVGESKIGFGSRKFCLFKIVSTGAVSSIASVLIDEKTGRDSNSCGLRVSISLVTRRVDLSWLNSFGSGA